MEKKPYNEIVPKNRSETIRRGIISILEEGLFSAKDISGMVKIREKDVYEHLYHIQKTIAKEGAALVVSPAECRTCGFRFKKRERLKKPGKCPVCRNESIKEPLFSIR